MTKKWPQFLKALLHLLNSLYWSQYKVITGLTFFSFHASKKHFHTCNRKTSIDSMNVLRQSFLSFCAVLMYAQTTTCTKLWGYLHNDYRQCTVACYKVCLHLNPSWQVNTHLLDYKIFVTSHHSPVVKQIISATNFKRTLANSGTQRPNGKQ